MNPRPAHARAATLACDKPSSAQLDARWMATARTPPRKGSPANLGSATSILERGRIALIASLIQQSNGYAPREPFLVTRRAP
jgi:hypothetical protein